MMIVALFSWWYGAGWARTMKRVGARMDLLLETFSVAILLRTLFDPFHQISAGQVRGSFDVQLRALGDRVFSRVFGAVVRSLFIIIGVVAALSAGLFGLLELLVWPLMPFLPLIGLGLTVIGWQP
jgi:hypothetical protein